MTREEAIKVAFAVSATDGGCQHCISEVFAILNTSNLGWKFHLVGEKPEEAEVVMGESYNDVAVEEIS